MTTITRSAGIDRLRAALSQLVDDDHSLCEVAARLGIYCHGFAQWNFDDLKQRYDWVVERHPHIGRERLEHFANIWQIARREVNQLPTACDDQALEHDTCLGWDEWNNADLARFLKEATGEEFRIVDDEQLPAAHPGSRGASDGDGD